MASFKMILSLGWMLFAIYPMHLLGQSQANVAPVTEFISQPLYRNHIAVMAGLAEGDGTLGRDGGEPIFSLLYSHSFTSVLEAEFAVHYLPVQHWRKPPNWYEDFRYLTLAWMFDASLMVQPFAQGSFLPGFRVGGGITFRTMRALSTSFVGGGFGLIGTDTVFSPRIRVANYAETSTLGANIKLEYLIPLTARLSLGIHARVVLFLYPFEGVSPQGSTFYTGRGGVGNVGIYLRFNW